MQNRAHDNVKRRIVISFKATGNNPDDGDCMTELACVEMMGLQRTGNDFHTFLYPGDKLMGQCAKEYRSCRYLAAGRKSAEATLNAMSGVPGFNHGGGAETILEHGVAEFLVSEITQAPLMFEIENAFTEYLHLYPDTVVIAHDMTRLKKFLRAELSKENWDDFDKNFGNVKHGMMQKSHKFRPVGLFPTKPGKSWMAGLDFDSICQEFDVSVKQRTHYSAMQDALMLTEAIIFRKEVKNDNIELFPDSKSYPVDTSTEEISSEDDGAEVDYELTMSPLLRM